MERELLMLGLLRQHAMHGYELHAFIENSMSGCVDLKKPTAYLLLERMEGAGWIEATESHEGNRPPRRVFRLTEGGEAAFQRLLRENLASYGEARFGGDVGLAFLDALPPAETRALLVERRAALAAALAAVEGAPPHGGSLHLVIDHQRHHLRSELAWLDGVIASLDG